MARGTLPQPKTRMPSEAVSRVKAMVVSNPRMLPKKLPAAAENAAQLVPNWNASGKPEPTPMANVSMKMLSQKRTWR